MGIHKKKGFFIAEKNYIKEFESYKVKKNVCTWKNHTFDQFFT